jgi:hypothetical protein
MWVPVLQEDDVALCLAMCHLLLGRTADALAVLEHDEARQAQQAQQAPAGAAGWAVKCCPPLGCLRLRCITTLTRLGCMSRTAVPQNAAFCFGPAALMRKRDPLSVTPVNAVCVFAGTNDPLYGPYAAQGRTAGPEARRAVMPFIRARCPQASA